MLICPMLDDRNCSSSCLQLADRATWDSRANIVGWTALLGEERGRPSVSPYAAAARASDLSGLPATFIDVGSVDLFRDEDVAYATRIRLAGGNAELHVWPGEFHRYESLAPSAPVSQATLRARRDWLSRLLAAR